MPTIFLTKRELAVTLDAIERLSALTEGEMADSLDWRPAEINAWNTALRKLDDATVAKDGTDTTSVVAQEHNRRAGQARFAR